MDELVAVDPESMSFRYAYTRKGQANLPAALERVNVGHIASVMLQVGILLDGAADGMGDMLSNVVRLSTVPPEAVADHEDLRRSRSCCVSLSANG